MQFPTVNIKNILFATDFSEGAEYVYAYAKRIADQFQASLTLIHVVQEDLLDLLIFDVGIDRSSGVQKRLSIVKEHFQDVKEKVIEKMKADYGEESITGNNTVVEKGNPVKMILKVAEEKNCDLIVMGKKGRGSLEDTMMGDTVRRVLHRSKFPVLVIQPVTKKG
jgi:nucleotide-binding universal stress UspA family protein